MNPSPRREIIGGIVCLLLATVLTGSTLIDREWGLAAIAACAIPFSVAGIIRGLRRLKSEKFE
jgi:hypothetical protein